MPVGIDDEKLEGAVGAGAARNELRSTLGQMLFPSLKIIHQEGIVVAAIVRNHFLFALADDVQFLINAETEPRPGKRKRRPRNGRQSEYIAIERDAPIDVSDMNGDVVELGDKHNR